MELILVGVICWLWFRLRAVSSRAAERDGGQASSRIVPFASVVVCEVDGFLYWLREGELVRAPLGDGLAGLDDAVPVDPLAVADIDPATIIEIIDALEGFDARVHRGAGGA